MFVIGVIGQNCREQTVQSLYKLFKSNEFKIEMLEIKESNTVKNNLKQYFDQFSADNIDIFIVSIPSSEIHEEFYVGVEFDIIVHVTNDKENISKDELEFLFNNERKIFNKLKTNSFAVINIDDDDYIRMIEGIKTCIITYGYNSKATITSSSIDDNSNQLALCQQRAIKTNKNSIVEPQEYVVGINNYNVQDIYNALVVESIGLIFGLR